MRKKDTPKVISLEGLEFLIIENGFVQIFKFLTTLKDYAIIHSTFVIVPVKEESLDERTIQLMHREFERLA